MYSLDFKVEYEYCPHSLLASDGLTVAIVPQSSSVKCYSWKRDTAQFIWSSLTITCVLTGLSTLKRTGELERRTSFMSSSVSSSFCPSLAWQACSNDLFWKCIRRSSYTGTKEKTPNNGQFLITSYMGLYIMDTYLYSKAPPGVNYFGCHRTYSSC